MEKCGSLIWSCCSRKPHKKAGEKKEEIYSTPDIIALGDHHYYVEFYTQIFLDQLLLNDYIAFRTDIKLSLVLVENQLKKSKWQKN